MKFIMSMWLKTMGDKCLLSIIFQVLSQMEKKATILEILICVEEYKKPADPRIFVYSWLRILDNEIAV